MTTINPEGRIHVSRDAGAQQAAIRELELAMNVALVTFGYDNLELRGILLKARGDVREALGEARS